MLLGCPGFVVPSKIRAGDRAGNRGLEVHYHSLISSEQLTRLKQEQAGLFKI